MTSQDHEPELQVMTWYNKADWITLKELFTDAQQLPPTYDDWLQKAEATIKEIESNGDLIVKVTIDTVLFPAWCKEKNRPMDAEARTTFAIEAVQKQQFLNNM